MAATLASRDGGGKPTVAVRAPVAEHVVGTPAGPPVDPAPKPGTRKPRLQDQDAFDERTDTPGARWLSGNPAYQALPWRGGGVLIDVAGIASAGRVALRVAHVGSPVSARRAYHRFLALHGDAGRGYVPRFVSWPEYRRLLCPPSSDADCPVTPAP